MMAKDTKEEANYRMGDETASCAQCTMFRQPESCTEVAGKISPDGLCDYFEPKQPMQAGTILS